MNWSIKHISNYDELEWFEKQNVSRKQNVYSLFTNHASKQYKKLSRDERIAMIKLVGIAEDDDYVDDLNYNKKWSSMPSITTSSRQAKRLHGGNALNF